MTRLSTIICGGLLPICSSCGSAPAPEPPRPPDEIRTANEAGFRAMSLERAAFDLRCEPGTLRIHALNALPGIGAQMGVECGERRMVYVFKQVGVLDASWVAETASFQP